MKTALIKTIPLISVLLAPLTANAADVTWNGSAGTNWATGANWDNNTGPIEGDVVYLPSGNVVFGTGISVNLRAFRLSGGTFTLSGGTFSATNLASWDTHVDATLNHTGTNASINELEVGRSSGKTGTYTLSGGSLEITRALSGYSLFIGSNKRLIDAGTGTFEISGGSLETRSGVKLGDNVKTGVGKFSVLGSAIGGIGIASTNGDTDGTWLQHSGSTLKVGIDLGGVTSIFIDDSPTGTTGTSATFESGSWLEVGYYNGGEGGGTWTVMEVENGDVIDHGLAFAPGVDRNVWSFSVDNSGANGLLKVTATGQPAGLPLIVGGSPKQMMRFGMDYERLWYWTNSMSAAEKDMVARWSVFDCNIDFIRVAINSEYELTEGSYNLSAYTDKIIPMMRDMQDANPNIKFFASPRPLNEAIDNAAWQPFPYWITGDPGSGANKGTFNFNWQKCAEYLVRYIQLMKSNGFKISYMDMTNEWNYVTATHIRDIRAYMESQLAAADMPLIVAPSAWSYAQGSSWFGGAYTAARRNAIDIAACHNTDKTGTAQDFADKIEQTYPGEGKEVWNSELHGWKGNNPGDEIPTSSFMFEAIRAGFTGISGWLAIGTTNQGHSYILNPSGNPTRNVKYFIFKKLSTTSNYGHALDINEPSQLTSTAALIKGNLMTVWVLNNSATSTPVRIKPTGRTISGSSVKRTRWNESLALEGVSESLEVLTNTSVWAEIPAKSLSCFEILLDPIGVQFSRTEAESFSEKSGMKTEACGDEGGTLNLANINGGTWSRYDNLTLGSNPVMRFRVARPAGRKDGWIEVRLDSPTGTLVGKVAVPETGAWQTYETIETTLDPVVGTHSVYLKFVEVGSTAGSPLFNLNWFSFPQALAPSGLASSPVSASRINLTWTAVPGATGYNLKRATTSGGPYSTLATGITTTSYNNTGLAAGTRYYYVLEAVYPDSVSAISEEVMSVPSNSLDGVNIVVGSSRVQRFPGGAGEFNLTMPNPGAGWFYQLQRVSSLGGTWLDTGSPVLSNGSIFTLTHPLNAGDKEHYFRARVYRQ